MVSYLLPSIKLRRNRRQYRGRLHRSECSLQLCVCMRRYLGLQAYFVPAKEGPLPSLLHSHPNTVLTSHSFPKKSLGEYKCPYTTAEFPLTYLCCFFFYFQKISIRTLHFLTQGSFCLFRHRYEDPL